MKTETNSQIAELAERVRPSIEAFLEQSTVEGAHIHGYLTGEISIQELEGALGDLDEHARGVIVSLAPEIRDLLIDRVQLRDHLRDSEGRLSDAIDRSNYLTGPDAPCPFSVPRD